MYIYKADCKRKIRLRQLTTKVEFNKEEPILRVGKGDYASRLSEQVTRAAVTHFNMPSRAGGMPGARSPREIIPPAVFEESNTGMTRVVYKEVVIRFGPKVPSRRKNQILKKHKLKVRRKNPFIADQLVAYVTDRRQAGEKVVAIANDCAEMDEVIFATPNFVSKFHRSANVTRIPPEQWHLCNRGDISGQKKGEDVNARGAWKVTRGNRGITVAVLDDGVDVEHPNLKTNIKKNPDPDEPRDLCGRDFFVPEGLQDHFNPRPKIFQFPYHKNGNDNHGTPCAGIIAAKGSGAFGIAPGCRILPVKIFHAQAIAPDAAVANAIRYAALHADVLSCSWSAPYNADIELAIEDANRLGRKGKGSAVFCASGNYAFFGNPIDFPAVCEDAIAVGASTDQGKRAVYSQCGRQLWIVAPSGGGKANVYTTDLSVADRGYNLGEDTEGGADGLHTNSFIGTSAATPLAAGVAALMLSVKPSLDRDAVKQIIADTAVKIGNDSDYDQHSHSLQYGYGRVNAAAAVDAAKSIQL
jgi:subtilisin family serine protease